MASTDNEQELLKADPVTAALIAGKNLGRTNTTVGPAVTPVGAAPNAPPTPAQIAQFRQTTTPPPAVEPVEPAGPTIGQRFENFGNAPLRSIGAGARLGFDTINAGLDRVMTTGAQFIEGGVHTGKQLVAGFTGGPPPGPMRNIFEEQYGNRTAPATPAPAPADMAAAPALPTAPNGTMPDSQTGSTNVPDGWVRTVTPSATDPNREIAAYSNGQGSYMTGERDRGTGGGTFNVMSMPKVPQGQAQPQGPYGPNQALYEAQVADAQRRNAAGAKPQTTWNEAFQDYAAGRVGTPGYGMVRNLMMRTKKTQNGQEVPDLAGVAALKGAMELAGLEVENQGKTTGNGNGLDTARYLLDQNKFAYQKDKDAKERARNDYYDSRKDEREGLGSRMEQSAAEREIYEKFAEGFMAPKGAPASLREDMWSIAQANGIRPERMQAAMDDTITGIGGKIDWGNEDKYRNFLAGVQQRAMGGTQ